LCDHFFDANIDRRTRQNTEKSCNGLFRYHHRVVVIPRPAIALIKALLIKKHDKVGQLNYRRFIASLLKRFWRVWMTSNFESYCQHCFVCNRAKPDRRGGAALQPLRNPKYLWEIVEIDNVTNLVESDGMYGYTIVLCYGLPPC